MAAAAAVVVVAAAAVSGSGLNFSVLKRCQRPEVSGLLFIYKPNKKRCIPP